MLWIMVLHKSIKELHKPIRELHKYAYTVIIKPHNQNWSP